MLSALLTLFTASGNVWHGTQEPWHNWDILAGRFVSEFGMYVRLRWRHALLV